MKKISLNTSTNLKNKKKSSLTRKKKKRKQFNTTYWQKGEKIIVKCWNLALDDELPYERWSRHSVLIEIRKLIPFKDEMKSLCQTFINIYITVLQLILQNMWKSIVGISILTKYSVETGMYLYIRYWTNPIFIPGDWKICLLLMQAINMML